MESRFLLDKESICYGCPHYNSHDPMYWIDKEDCMDENGGDFWGKDVCEYHTHRDRTHGRKAPVEKKMPKCTLFGIWLEKSYQKCEKCQNACEQVKEAEER